MKTTGLIAYTVQVLFLNVSHSYRKLFLNDGIKQAGLITADVMDSEDGLQFVEDLFCIEKENMVPLQYKLRFKS